MITKLEKVEVLKIFEILEAPMSLLSVLSHNLPEYQVHNWAKSGSLKSIKKFNNVRVEDYDWTVNDPFDSTPLYYACHSGACKGDIELVTYLLGLGEYGEDVIERCYVNAISEDVKRVLRGSEVNGDRRVTLTVEKKIEKPEGVEEGGGDMGLANLFREEEKGGDY